MEKKQRSDAKAEAMTKISDALEEAMISKLEEISDDFEEGEHEFDLEDLSAVLLVACFDVLIAAAHENSELRGSKLGMTCLTCMSSEMESMRKHYEDHLAGHQMLQQIIGALEK